MSMDSKKSDENIDFGDEYDITKEINENKINLKKELIFATNLYRISMKDFKSNPPPNPMVWLMNRKKLMKNWESYKVTVIGEINHNDTSKEDKEGIAMCLESSIALYMDLMSSICTNFENEIENALLCPSEF